MTTPTGSSQFLVDSSGWVEFLGETPRAESFGKYIGRENQLIVPTIVIYEVSKKLQRLEHHTAAQRFLSHVFRTRVVYLDADLAILAARVSLEHRLAMADAIIYATAQSCKAQLVTGDTHFRGLPGVTLL